MSILSTTLLALTMSADAFAASISKGLSLHKPSLGEALKVGAVFAGVETLMPLIGWLAGWAASNFITSVDHWVAFILLSLIGLHMIRESIDQEKEEATEKPKTGFLILTAIGTSIDSLAAGVTMAFLNINILIAAAAIGCATFTMSTFGYMCGHCLGLKAGRWAEATGGLVLIGLGVHILLKHTGYLG